MVKNDRIAARNGPDRAYWRFFSLFQAPEPYLYMINQFHVVFYILSKPFCEINNRFQLILAYILYKFHLGAPYRA